MFFFGPLFYGIAYSLSPSSLSSCGWAVAFSLGMVARLLDVYGGKCLLCPGSILLTLKEHVRSCLPCYTFGYWTAVTPLCFILSLCFWLAWTLSGEGRCFYVKSLNCRNFYTERHLEWNFFTKLGVSIFQIKTEEFDISIESQWMCCVSYPLPQFLFHWMLPYIFHSMPLLIPYSYLFPDNSRKKLLVRRLNSNLILIFTFSLIVGERTPKNYQNYTHKIC